MWCWRLVFRLLSTHMHVTDLCISPCLPRFAVTASVSAWLQRKSWTAGKCKTCLCSSSSATIIVVWFTAASSTCCKLPSSLIGLAFCFKVAINSRRSLSLLTSLFAFLKSPNVICSNCTNLVIASDCPLKPCSFYQVALYYKWVWALSWSTMFKWWTTSRAVGWCGMQSVVQHAVMVTAQGGGYWYGIIATFQSSISKIFLWLSFCYMQ